MNAHRIERLDDPRLADYRDVAAPERLRGRGLFVAEGRLVVRTLLTSARFHARSVLVSPAAYVSLSDVLDRCPAVPVFVAELAQLEPLVGFDVHRGCLAIGERGMPPSASDVLESAAATGRLIVVERVANADNMGAIFRNARALGAGGVLLSPGCCDPLYRKAIRVSIGATLRMPWTVLEAWPGGLGHLRDHGYHVAGLTPGGRARELSAFAGDAPARLALLVGHEGEGLTGDAVAACDSLVRIEMHDDADSVNVAAATGIALYICRRQRA